MIIDKQSSTKSSIGYTCTCKCDICSKIFYRKAHWAERTKHQFCSKQCFCIFRSTKSIGKNGSNWRGGIRPNSWGYIEIYAPNHPNKNVNATVREHRLIMEKHLGRYLRPEEIVHHINGVRNDNRLDNLILFSDSGEHQRFHGLFRNIAVVLYYLFKYNCLNLILKEEK